MKNLLLTYGLLLLMSAAVGGGAYLYTTDRLPLHWFSTEAAVDETLDPKAAAWGEPRPLTIPDSENGFHALIALSAPDGADELQFARDWVAAARAGEKSPRDPPWHAFIIRGDIAPCDMRRVSCVEWTADRGERSVKMLGENANLLLRYRKLIASKQYEDGFDFMAYAVREPPMRWMKDAQRLFFTQAALAVHAGKMDAAIAALEQHNAFYRIMLEGGNTLISKQNAIEAMRVNRRFLLDLLRHNAAAMKPFLPRLRKVLEALDDRALSLDRLIETQFGAVKRNLTDPEVVSRLGGLHYYKPNATVNLMFNNYRDAAAMLHQPPGAIKPMKTDGEDKKAASRSLLKGNPRGRAMVEPLDYSDLALYLHDFDGFNRLLALRVEALAAGVDASTAAEFAANTPARLHDPYTAKPMRWNEELKRFEFMQRSVLADDIRFYPPERYIDGTISQRLAFVEI